MRQVSFSLFCAVILLSVYGIEDKSKYYFSSPEDKATCTTLVFDKVTASRRFSKSVQMSQLSADQCCKLRGMNLYTIEKVDEPAGFATVASGKIGGSTWFWTSATNFQEKYKYRWEFGKTVGENVSGFAQWDVHDWDVNEPNRTTPGLCVIARAEGKKMLMKSVNCKEPMYPFMCEMQPQKGGASITNGEILRCVNSEVAPLPGFPNLRIFEDTGRWPVANYCCQRQGWILMDNVHPKGEAFYTAVTESDFGQPFEGMEYTAIWTSGNDLCEFRRWQWGCGEDGSDMNWFGDEVSQNPDNLKGMEDCVEYHNANESLGFAGNDITCDVENFIICDVAPRCSVPEQYPCGAQDPRSYDPRDLIEEDAIECDSATFTEKKSNDTTYPHIFYVSDKKVSWLGAVNCCQKKGMSLAAFYKVDDKYEASKIVLAMEFATGEFQPYELWTAATNWNLSKRAPIAWPNGNPVAEFMLPKVKLHGDMYPVCGKLMDLPTKGINVLTANCLDKNLIMCMKDKEQATTESSSSGSGSVEMDEEQSEETGAGSNGHSPDASGEMGGTSGSDGTKGSDGKNHHGGHSKVPSTSDPAQELLYNKTLAIPTEQEEQFTVNLIKKDRCPSFVLENYPLKCPKSSSIIGINKKPKIPPKLTTEEKFKISQQNKRILATMITNGVYGKPVSPHSPTFGFKLLATSVEIYTNLCPIVPADFVKTAFTLFHDLHWMTAQGRSSLMGEKDYKWILKLLQKCKMYSKPVHARTEGCGETLIAVDNCTNFVCTSPRLEFKLYGTDPIVDIMWKVYEIVHAICFPAFEESYRMFHKYAQSMMDLWTHDIKLRWFNQLADNLYWRRVLGPSYEVHLVNMERCSQATIMRAFFHIRLPRNTIPDRTRLIGTH